MTGRSDAVDLRSLLGRAAAYGVAPAQITHACGREDALGAVLRALRGCVLPRWLAVAQDGVPVADLLVADGRLVELRGADLPQGALTAQDLDRVAALLSARLTGGDISLHPQRPEVAPDEGQTGLCARDLYAALGLAPSFCAPQDWRDTLLGAAAEVLIARVPLQGAPELQGDVPADTIERLQGWLGPGGLAETLGRGELLTFAFEGLGIALLVADGQPEALVFDADAVPDLARFWSELPGMAGAAP
ncbi:hypothetical protein KO516_03360 [Citreicella sp. C3M06]|uniref:hypothetical protein n=1 Tax=Citreicella sp. C3M06 TaxID=2841564 RepID=UPI001C0840A7|nr:hypothetical protein [Citreicella sp. C3M06]MBU2959878.1 hypothetical protein [Citreicella sp. C3M06]